MILKKIFELFSNRRKRKELEAFFEKKRLKLDAFYLTNKDKFVAWKKDNPKLYPPIVWSDVEQDWVWLTREQRREMKLESKCLG